MIWAEADLGWGVVEGEVGGVGNVRKRGNNNDEDYYMIEDYLHC